MYESYNTHILIRWMSLLLDNKGVVTTWLEQPYFETNKYYALSLWKHHSSHVTYEQLNTLIQKQIHDIGSCLALRHPLKEIERYHLSLEDYHAYPESLSVYFDKSYLGCVHFFDVFGDQIWNISKPYHGDLKEIYAFIRVYQIFHMASYIVKRLHQWSDQESEVVRLNTIMKYPLVQWISWIREEQKLSKTEKQLLSWKDIFCVYETSLLDEEALIV